MSRLTRALMMGALGAAASGAVLAALRPRQAPPKPLAPRADPSEVDAGRLSDEETDGLMRELARDLDA